MAATYSSSSGKPRSVPPCWQEAVRHAWKFQQCTSATRTFGPLVGRDAAKEVVREKKELKKNMYKQNKVMETQPRSPSLHNNTKDWCPQYRCKRFCTDTDFCWRPIKYQSIIQSINHSNKDSGGSKSILFFANSPGIETSKKTLMFCIIPGKVM